ncbi:MAG: hypothetical protein O7H41_01565 [Planctomycetota bacterium]|nr:hypothetical protein [Planctomycetota bacterium]
MPWLKWIIVLLAVTEAGWMTFDGLRALTSGDYVTPKTGEWAGKLGPWSHLVSAVGIEPRSTLMKCIFVVYGIVWLGVTAAFALGRPWAWWPMFGLSVGSLWYLMIGTGTSVLLIILLLLPAVRRGFQG